MDGSASSGTMGRSMTLPGDTSRRIEFLRMLLVLGIICIHYGRLPGHELHPLLGYAGQDHGIAVFLTSFVVYAALCGVPTLSAISGFLFFRGATAHRPPPFLDRLKRRAKSLFVPLLIWNGMLLLVAVALVSVFPNDTLIRLLAFDPRQAGWFDYLDAWIGITRDPVVYPMWFVRDLCLTAFLSPLWWLFARHAWWLGGLILGGAWLAGHDLWIFFRTDIPFFFYLGMLVAINRWTVELPKRTALILLAAYLALVAIRVVLPVQVGTEPVLWLDVATRLMRLLGVVAIWTTAPLVLDMRWARVVQSWSPLAFFIHSSHFPLISVLNYIILANLLPRGNDLFLLLHFALTVTLTLALLFFGAAVLKRIAPPLLHILSGSRQQPAVRTVQLA